MSGNAKLSAVDVKISYTTKDRKTAKTTTAVNGISLDIAEGEFICIVGPSGCGKTTFMTAITGMLPLSGGHFELNGSKIVGPGKDRATVFQAAQLLPWRTIVSNVGYGLEVLGWPKAKRVARSKELLDLVGLADFAEHYPHQLSGGMKQRANLARALAVDSEVLLMDEPFAALDAQTREFMQGELQRIWAHSRKTTIFVTHSISEAVFLADRVVVFSRRPAKIREIVTVDLPRPRDLSIKHSEEFQVLESKIWELIDNSEYQTPAAV